MSKSCLRCSFCCSHAKFSLPKDEKAKDEAKWYLLHGCRTIERENLISVIIPITCASLAFNGKTKEYFCATYEDRPNICRKYICDYMKGGESHDV